jgi:hypothetical protein
MAEIQSGFVSASYLFDVAQAIDLPGLKQHFGTRASAARLDDKAPGPPRLQYVQPPLIVEGGALALGDVEEFRVRLKFYDYGVIAVLLSRPFSGSWAELVGLGQALIENEPLEDRAAAMCRQVVDGIRSLLKGTRSSFLSEDYFVFAVTALDQPAQADQLLELYGIEIAQLLRGERQSLSRQERDEVLRHRLSYLADDLVIPAWNAAFIYDSEPAALATMEILELANSHLLEFRYHDDLLDSELTNMYSTLQAPKWTDRFAGRRHSQATRKLQTLFIDVNELTDRMENAVKLVGDVYSARLFGIVSARLGLERWKRNVEEKLKTLDDIYRFAVEQTGMSQGNILEFVIVLILLIEFGMLLAGLTK